MNAGRLATTLLAAGGLILLASPSIAQDGDPMAAAASRRATDTPADRFGFFRGEQVQVSTGTEDDNLTFRAALPTGASQASRFSLVLATPLHGGDDAMPASLDALANGSRATLRWGLFAIPTAAPNAPEIEEEALSACRDRRANPQPGDDAALTVEGCRAEPINNIVRNYARPRYREYLRRVLRTGAIDVGLDGTVGINDFAWVDPVTLAPREERHTDWGVAANLAYYLPGTAITASVSYQRAYKAADEQLLCPPNPVDPATQCITARGAAPKRSEHFLITAGLRYRFVGADGELLNLAVAPQVTYDVEDDVFGVDVPVYFVPGANGGLTGGVRFGYRSDREDAFSVAVFVGAAFSLWQQ